MLGSPEPGIDENVLALEGSTARNHNLSKSFFVFTERKKQRKESPDLRVLLL